MALKLMVDMSTDVSGSVELNESSGEKTYVISGNFSTPGKKNRNGRLYSMDIWESNVAKYQNEITNNTNNTLMELEHPPRTQVDPWEAVAKIRKLEMKDGYVYGEAVILNNGDKKTNQIKALIEAGLRIGVSTRGTGKMKGDIVEEYNLITVDVVSNPSNYESSLEGFNESMILESLDIEIDEAGKYVCTPAGCTLVSDKKLDESEEEKSDDLNEKSYWKDYVKDYQTAIGEICGIIKDKADEKTYNKISDARFGLSDLISKAEKSIKDINESEELDESISSEPSCGCKAKVVVEALEKFANKGIESEQDKADRLIKEKFDALFEKKKDKPVWNISRAEFQNASDGWLKAQEDIVDELMKLAGNKKKIEQWIEDNNADFDVIEESLDVNEKYKLETFENCTDALYDIEANVKSHYGKLSGDVADRLKEIM